MGRPLTYPTDSGFKICTLCLKRHPATREFFVSRNHGIGSWCKPCGVARAAEASKKHYAAIRGNSIQSLARTQKNTEKVREWRAKNREHVRAYKRALYYKQKTTQPKRVIASRLRHHFGMTLPEYEQRLVLQKNVCAICHKPESSKANNGAVKPLAVDHDHYSGKIRGLLCTRCNVAIGYLKDDPQLCKSAANYLEQHLGCS